MFVRREFLSALGGVAGMFLGMLGWAMGPATAHIGERRYLVPDVAPTWGVLATVFASVALAVAVGMIPRLLAGRVRLEDGEHGSGLRLLMAVLAAATVLAVGMAWGGTIVDYLYDPAQRVVTGSLLTLVMMLTMIPPAIVGARLGMAAADYPFSLSDDEMRKVEKGSVA